METGSTSAGPVEPNADLVAASPRETAPTEAAPAVDACAPGMVPIVGAMKVDGATTVEAMQSAVCLKWLPSQYADRCARYDRDRWLATSAPLATRPMRFCMDRFEFPNERGGEPAVGMSSRHAQRQCAQEGKRLCTEDEWTFACEGEEALPYPTGYVRDADACVIDRPLRPVNELLLVNRYSDVTQREYRRLWQGGVSGAHPRCASVFGVEDMIGNVDEWTAATRPGYAAVLKGGYWGPIRARCRPSTRYHGEGFYYYQQGFRCCSDAH